MSALIETVRVIAGVAPLWPLHMERLTKSGDALGIPIPDLDRPSGGEDRVVRFAIDLFGVAVSEAPVGEAAAVELMTAPAVHRGYPHKIADRGWLKAARNSIQILGADDALLLDGEGRMVESTIWAIGWWEGEHLYFPPLELGGLPSVARARLSETVRGRMLTAPLERDQLAWRSLLACNAARGVVEVAALDGDPVPSNSRTKALQRRFWARASG